MKRFFTPRSASVAPNAPEVARARPPTLDLAAAREVARLPAGYVGNTPACGMRTTSTESRSATSPTTAKTGEREHPAGPWRADGRPCARRSQDLGWLTPFGHLGAIGFDGDLDHLLRAVAAEGPRKNPSANTIANDNAIALAA